MSETTYQPNRPSAGDIYRCSTCGFELQVNMEGNHEDRGTELKCCGRSMGKIGRLVHNE